MKILSTFRYLFFALIILGYFANFAQNEYGLDLIDYGLGLISLSYLFDLLILGKETLRKKRVLIPLIILSLLGIISIIPILLGLEMSSVSEFLIRAILFFLFVIGVPLCLLIVSLNNQKKYRTYSQFKVLEAFGLFLFFSAIEFKFSYQEGAGVLIVISGAFMTVLYLYRTFKLVTIKTEHTRFNNNYLAIYYFLVCLALVGLVFKTMHWPGGIIIILAALCLVISADIVAIFYNRIKKEKLKTVSIENPNFQFVLTYLKFSLIVIVLTSWNILPKFYSLEVPAALKKLREQSPNPQSDPKVIEYENNYNKFITNRTNEEMFEQHIIIANKQ